VKKQPYEQAAARGMGEDSQRRTHGEDFRPFDEAFPADNLVGDPPMAKRIGDFLDR